MANDQQPDYQELHRRHKNRESLLETLESIVVAFILAFIFRAFLVEAFVIPTGSMAANLYGEHLEFTCEDCGYEFAVGLEASKAREFGITSPQCPNCGLEQPVTGLRTYSGDRILVLKFLYDFEEPQRWDVIVFRNPNDPAQNYIKRLVALPGETIQLDGGDVTTKAPGEDAFRVRTKTDEAQEALWMPVHDTRYRPHRNGWEPRWIGEGGWTVRDGGYVLAEADADAGPAWLTYRHRNPAGDLDYIRDYYAYNSASGGGSGRWGLRAVTDLALRSKVTLADAEARLVVELRAWRDRLRFELTAEGSAAPSQILLKGEPIARAPDGVLPVGRPANVLVANVDHKAMLWVNGRRVLEPLTETVSPEGDPMYEPTRMTEDEREAMKSGPTGPAEVRLKAAGGGVDLGYLRIDRDVYYVNERRGGLVGGHEPGYGTEGAAFQLREDEFFVMGDNSPHSYDSRLWQMPNQLDPDAKDRPVVPRRNLVGKAFFVYWPSAGWRARYIPLAPDPAGWRFVH